MRLLEAGAERLVFVFNHQDHAVEPLIRVAGKRWSKRLEPGEVWLVRP